MTHYPDTSFLCSLYRRQEHTPKALFYRKEVSQPLPASTLLEFEFKQAVRLQVWLHQQDKRKGYSQSEADQMLADWETDIAAGHIAILQPDMGAVLRMAEHLSVHHTPELGNRTLDILHVATAKYLSAAVFLSFDDRQRKLAIAAGLTVPF